MPEKLATTRPWTQHFPGPAKFQRSRVEIKTPVINTYAKQLKQCDQLYNKVTETLRKSDERLPQINTTEKTEPLRWHKLSKSAPGTFYHDGPYNMEQLELSLADHFRERRHHTEFIYHGKDEHDDETRSESELSEHIEINPYQLSDILHRRGLDKPLIVTFDQYGREIRKSRHRKVRKNNGALPKNPTLREKIKGRARLDYEMANMRAAAFCERQAQRKFRTASAITRNRDVELVEEDFLERINRAENNINKNDEDDDTGSIVMSIDKEELFQRIDKWIIDVNSALRQSDLPACGT